MPDNPNAKLPDNVSDEISDDATVVSEDLAVTPEGEVKNIETGETVTDATLVGTQDQQPDPLAKTNGESFIPVSAEDVKNAVADANVQLSKFEGNEYGAHWGTYNNTKAFFDYQNNVAAYPAWGEFLKQKQPPTLIVWGEQDSALGLETLDGTERYVRDLTIERLPGVSHWVQQEAPEKVNTILKEWLPRAA